MATFSFFAFLPKILLFFTYLKKKKKKLKKTKINKNLDGRTTISGPQKKWGWLPNHPHSCVGVRPQCFVYPQ
jgi:hypothetical protein